jgi:hypothetical protein
MTGKRYSLTGDGDGVFVRSIRAVFGAETVPPALLLEGGNTDALSDKLATTISCQVVEEVGVGAAQILDCLLRGVLRDVPHPRELAIFDRVKRPAQCDLRRLTTALELSTPLSQGPILGKPSCPAGANKMLLLLRTWD